MTKLAARCFGVLIVLVATVGTGAPVGAQTSVQLNYVANGDSNGLLYHLGSQGGSWSNPVPTSATVNWTFGDANTNTPEVLSNRANLPPAPERIAVGPNVPTGSQIFIEIILPAGSSLTPNHLALRSWTYDLHHLRSWVVEGRQPGATTWQTLRTHANDPCLTSGKTCAWPVTSSTGYDAFRVRLTGPSSSNANLLALEEWEFYGTYQPAATPPPTTTTTTAPGATTTTTTTPPGTTTTTTTTPPAEMVTAEDAWGQIVTVFFLGLIAGLLVVR